MNFLVSRVILYLSPKDLYRVKVALVGYKQWADEDALGMLQQAVENGDPVGSFFALRVIAVSRHLEQVRSQWSAYTIQFYESSLHSTLLQAVEQRYANVARFVVHACMGGSTPLHVRVALQEAVLRDPSPPPCVATVLFQEAPASEVVYWVEKYALNGKPRAFVESCLSLLRPSVAEKLRARLGVLPAFQALH